MLADPQNIQPATYTLTKGKEAEQVKPALATPAEKRNFDVFFNDATQHQPQVQAGESGKQNEFTYNNVDMALNLHSPSENTLINQPPLVVDNGNALDFPGFDLLREFNNSTQNM